MHRFIVSLLFGSALIAQVSQSTRLSTGQAKIAEGARLARLLREKGTDALVDEVLRPGRELWGQVKQSLAKPDGLVYFSENVQSTLLPEMSGELVSQNGTELMVRMAGSDAPDVMLKLDVPFSGLLQPGSRVLFAGVAVDFAPMPFLFVMEVSTKDVRFLPAK